MKLSTGDRKRAMESHMFIKEKRDGTVKAQTAAGCNKQHGTIDKTEASSPAASLESVLLTLVMDAQERRNVAKLTPQTPLFRQDWRMKKTWP
jgi:hypothetical protein